MSLQTFVVTGASELSRALDPERWWQAIERHAPRSLQPVLSELRTVAPKGRTGKLRRRFEARARRIQQGLIRGVEVGIGATVPYGHLVERGHRIIARGRARGSRGAIIGTRQGTIRARFLLGGVGERQGPIAIRSTRARELKQRRSAGPIGHVPGVFFARKTVESRRAQIMSLLERLVLQDIRR